MYNIHKQNDLNTQNINAPHTIHNEARKKHIDQETGEEIEDPTPDSPKNSVPLKTGTESPAAGTDMRKMFFQKLLHGGSTSVISGQLDNMRKAQSMDNLNFDDNEQTNDESSEHKQTSNNRPRSASPTLSLRTKEGSEKGSDVAVQGSISDLSESTNNLKINNDSVDDGASASEEFRSEPDSIDSPLKVPLAKRLSSDSKVTNYAKDNLEISLRENEVDSNQSEHGGSTMPESPASSEKSKCRPFLDIPEFTWSPAHQKLLTELLFSIEKNIQVWRT